MFKSNKKRRLLAYKRFTCRLQSVMKNICQATDFLVEILFDIRN